MSARITHALQPLTPDDLVAIGRERSQGALEGILAGVFGCVNAHAFTGPFSRPSQDLMAAELRVARETVNRACAELRRLGWIDWGHVREAGAKWAHNRYVILRGWKAAGTARVLALLERIRGRRPRSDHTKTPLPQRRNQQGANYVRQNLETVLRKARPPNLLTVYEPTFDEVAW